MSRTGRLICLSLICLFLIGTGSFAQDRKTDNSKPLKSTTGAVFRSMAVPGWGQFYNESYYKAIAFAIVEGIQISGIVRAHNKMLDSKNAHFEPSRIERESAIVVESKYAKAGQDVIRFREQRNKTIWWFVGTVLLSMGDAYVDAQLYGIDVSPDLSFKQDMTVGVIASINF